MAVIRLDPEAPQKTFDIFVNLVEFGHPACIGILLIPRFIEGVGRASEPNNRFSGFSVAFVYGGEGNRGIS